MNVKRFLVKRMKVIYVQGKTVNKVPILFTPEMQHGISRLNKFRKQIGVSKDNHYLFPCSTKCSVNAVKPWDIVHEVAFKCSGLKEPGRITSNKIRKHVATVLQLLDLNETKLSWLADHLGHSIDVHRIWYRQEESTVELTRVARVLLAKDDGIQFTNKKIQDLKGLYIVYICIHVHKYV